MLRDLTNNVTVAESLRPAARTAATSNGEGVFLQGYDSAVVAVTIGALSGTAGDSVVTLEESDDNSTFTAVAAADILGATPAALAANTAYQFGYRGSKPYIRAVWTKGGETSVTASAVVVLGHPHRTA